MSSRHSLNGLIVCSMESSMTISSSMFSENSLTNSNDSIWTSLLGCFFSNFAYDLQHLARSLLSCFVEHLKVLSLLPEGMIYPLNCFIRDCLDSSWRMSENRFCWYRNWWEPISLSLPSLKTMFPSRSVTSSILVSLDFGILQHKNSIISAFNIIHNHFDELSRKWLSFDDVHVWDWADDDFINFILPIQQKSVFPFFEISQVL